MIRFVGSNDSPIQVVPYWEGLELAPLPPAVSLSVVGESSGEDRAKHLPHDGVPGWREDPGDRDDFHKLHGVYLLSSGEIAAVYGGTIQS